MSLAASIQITDQDIYQQQSVAPAEKIGQPASTPSGKIFALAKAGGTLTAGQITEPVAVTANYATRTLTTAVAQYSNQVIVPLGTTASADAFIGFWLIVTDGTGKGQGAYYITGNTAATAGNSNTTTVNVSGAINIALDTTSVVGIYPNQEITVIQHTAVLAIPCAGAPIINVTSGYYFWNQIGGMASILSDGAITKNAQGIPSDATAGSVEIRVDATIAPPVGYAPELTVSTKYSPFVLTLEGL
jgi:hypothetical protein